MYESFLDEQLINNIFWVNYRTLELSRSKIYYLIRSGTNIRNSLAKFFPILNEIHKRCVSDGFLRNIE